MNAKQKVRATVCELFGESIGCADGGCVFGHPGGMHTNGGCNCLKDPDRYTLVRIAMRLNQVATKLADQ